MQKMNIEISYQDQMFLENVCAEKSLSYGEFFKICLELYKESVEAKAEGVKKKAKKETLPKKHNQSEKTN